MVSQQVCYELEPKQPVRLDQTHSKDNYSRGAGPWGLWRAGECWVLETQDY